MAETREDAIRQCPHCGSACAVGPGARECPCCGQGYGAQGLADHLPLPDDDARFAPAALAAAAVVALIVVAAVALTPWALVALGVTAAIVLAVLATARRRPGAR
jgi:hypothetical protein